MLEVGKEYVTKDGRRTGILKEHITDGKQLFRAELIKQFGGTSPNGQLYYFDGSVFREREEEKNDEIVGPWIEPPPATYVIVYSGETRAAVTYSKEEAISIVRNLVEHPVELSDITVYECARILKPGVTLE